MPVVRPRFHLTPCAKFRGHLNTSAAVRGLSPLLEVSTKSDEKLGQRLSAFNLKVFAEKSEVAFESAYQGSKVFSNGGPYTDLYNAEPRDAKRDLRIRDSGTIVGTSNSYFLAV